MDRCHESYAAGCHRLIKRANRIARLLTFLTVGLEIDNLETESVEQEKPPDRLTSAVCLTSTCVQSASLTQTLETELQTLTRFMAIQSFHFFQFSFDIFLFLCLHYF